MNLIYLNRYEREDSLLCPDKEEILVPNLNKSFPICRTISYYIEAYTLINRSFEFHFMKTV
jgi:hypothetical protein